MKYGFIDNYFKDHQKILDDFLKIERNKEDLLKAMDILKNSRSNGQRIFLLGNGGSAGIAEHMAVDLTKNANLSAQTFSGTPILTAFANDYGYKHIFERCIESYCAENDILLAISSSGSSENIVRACDAAKKKNMTVMTFTGFDKNNPVNQMGDLNFWVDSRGYGFVELIHNLLIHCVNDAIIGASVY